LKDEQTKSNAEHLDFVYKLPGNETLWQPRVEAESSYDGSINVDSFVNILDRKHGEWIFWYLILIYFLLERAG
jgi:hypothetical protein